MEKVMVMVLLGETVPELNAPPSAVMVCGAAVVFVTVRGAPRRMLSITGQITSKLIQTAVRRVADAALEMP